MPAVRLVLLLLLCVSSPVGLLSQEGEERPPDLSEFRCQRRVDLLRGIDASNQGRLELYAIAGGRCGALFVHSLVEVTQVLPEVVDGDALHHLVRIRQPEPWSGQNRDRGST